MFAGPENIVAYFRAAWKILFFISASIRKDLQQYLRPTIEHTAGQPASTLKQGKGMELFIYRQEDGCDSGQHNVFYK